MAAKTIVLRGKGIRKERLATAVAITPGYLIERTPSASTVREHGTAGGFAQRMFAVENEVVGGGIDDDYAASDNILYEVLPPGAEVFALLAASAPAIVEGDLLESAGDGTLRVQVAVADLTDDSGGTASDTLVAITGSYVEATIENTVASLAAKINALLPGARQGGAIVAIAMEDVDNSGGGGEVRIKVELV